MALAQLFPGVTARRRARLLALVLAWSAPWSAAGHAEGLTLADALRRSVASAPDLDVATAAIDEARAGEAIAALRPAWETSFTLENFAGGGDASGFDAAEATLELGRTLESQSKREQRVRASQAAVATAEAGLGTTRAGRIASVLQQYLATWVSQERARLLAEIAGTARQAVATAQRRVESGRSSEAELSAARSRAAQAELDARVEQSRVASGLQSLAALLDPTGADRPGSLEWNGSVRDLDAELPTVPAAIQQAAAQRQQAEQELAYAKTQARPDWQVAAGVRRLEELDTEALVFSVSRPWSTRERAKPVVEQAAAQLRRARAEEAVTTRDATLEQARLRAEIEARRLEVDTLERTIVPEATHARDVYRHGYALGRFSIVEISAAERDVLDASTRAIEARAALASAELGYRLLTGRWLDTEDSTHD